MKKQGDFCIERKEYKKSLPIHNKEPVYYEYRNKVLISCLYDIILMLKL